ncbi:MAG TPA: class I SAM-dependent methyltransferase [Alphaproteobacteria bacterium]|nr:class I SAM-dependent methyltransferase [Alphaproteobacteria bacterium]
MSEPRELAHFGFREIPAAEKASRVRAVFDSVARRYDLMNDLMSGGLHRLWKDAFVTWLRPRAGMHLVDLAGGTGDIAFRFRRAGGGPVIVTDINAAMLSVGRGRAERRRLSEGLTWLCGDAEALPLPDGCADAVTCAFGIRNMTHVEAALAEIRRVLKPGGRFLCLEFSRLALPGLQGLYDAYSFRVVPRLGGLVAQDEESYRYLVESIRRFPDQDHFAAMIAAAGLGNVEYRNLAGGIAAMHSAWRI